MNLCVHESNMFTFICISKIGLFCKNFSVYIFYSWPSNSPDFLWLTAICEQPSNITLCVARVLSISKPKLHHALKLLSIMWEALVHVGPDLQHDSKGFILLYHWSLCGVACASYIPQDQASCFLIETQTESEQGNISQICSIVSLVKHLEPLYPLPK